MSTEVVRRDNRLRKQFGEFQIQFIVVAMRIFTRFQSLTQRETLGDTKFSKF